MKACTICGDKFTGEEISEWKEWGEPFSRHPFICPDCYDREITHKDLEDQFDTLMNLEPVNIGDDDLPSGLDGNSLGCVLM